MTARYRIRPDSDWWWPVPAAGDEHRDVIAAALTAALTDGPTTADDVRAQVARLLAQADVMPAGADVFVAVGLPTRQPLLAAVLVAPAREPDYDYLLEIAQGVEDDGFGRPGVAYVEGETGIGVHVLRHDLVDGVPVASRTLALRQGELDVVVAVRTADIASASVAGDALHHLVDRVEVVA